MTLYRTSYVYSHTAEMSRQTKRSCTMQHVFYSSSDQFDFATCATTGCQDWSIQKDTYTEHNFSANTMNVLNGPTYRGSETTHSELGDDKVKNIYRKSQHEKPTHFTKHDNIGRANYLVFPVVQYGSNSWTLKIRNKRRLNVLKSWCLRLIFPIPW